MANIPDDLHYSKDHEWVRVEGNIAVVGITDYAQDSLGDVVYVELPDVGSTITQGKVFGTIESVKAVSDVIAPMSGEVIGINEAVSETPELVNEDPYTSGWLVKVRLSNPSEADGLMSAKTYESQLSSDD